MEQDPEADQTVTSGSNVNLTVSAGSEMVTVPFVIGRTRAEAEQLLVDAGLRPEFRVRDDDEPRNIVLETDPTAAESVPAGSTVTVFVSSGPVEVPNVVGLTEDEATSRLEDAGFDVDVEEDETTPSEPGTVLDQSPEGLTEAPRGSTVTIVVSDFEEPSPTEAPTPTETVEPTDTEEPTPTPSSEDPSPTEDEED
jgi:serine/threonine-protein kinase